MLSSNDAHHRIQQPYVLDALKNCLLGLLFSGIWMYIVLNFILFEMMLSFVYQDPTNLQGKNQKHQAFEAELNANQSRLDAVDNTGQQLINDEHYASDQVQERLDELHQLWNHLFDRSKDKGEKENKINLEVSNKELDTDWIAYFFFDLV